MARAQGCEARRIETHDELLARARRPSSDAAGPHDAAAARGRRRAGRDVRPLIHRLEHGVRPQRRARQHRRRRGPGGARRPGRTATPARRCRSSRSAPARPRRRSSGSARASRPWRRRRRRASGRRAARPTAPRPATWRTRPSAGCRPTASPAADRPSGCGSAARATCSRARRAQHARAHDRPVGGEPDRADLADVLPDRLVEHQPEPPAVAGDERDAGPDRAPQPVRDRRAGGQHDGPAVGAPQPADELEHGVVAGAGDAREPDDLAARDGQVERLEAPVDGDAAQLEPPPAPRPRSATSARSSASARLARASPSIASTIAGTVSSARGRALIATLPVAQHRDLVAQRHHVLEDVRDEHDADLAVAQHAQRVAAASRCSSRPSAEVGSSRISTRGSVSSALAISSSWRSASDSSPTSCAQRHVEAELGEHRPRARGHRARGRRTARACGSRIG